MAHYIAAFGRLPNGSVVPSERAEIFCAAKRVPVGVVGLITPWNFPIAVPSWKIFPALLAGNTVVFKPAEDTPGFAVTFVEILAEAGVPADAAVRAGRPDGQQLARVREARPRRRRPHARQQGPMAEPECGRHRLRIQQQSCATGSCRPPLTSMSSAVYPTARR